MPIVKVGDQRIKFPDDMSQEDIRAVLQKQFSPSKPVPGSELLSPEAQSLPPEHQRLLLEARERQLGVLPESVRPTAPSASSQRKQAFESLRERDPFLAQTIEELGPVEAAAVGFQQGLRTLGRGVSRPFGGDVFQELEDPALQELQKTRGSAQLGKIAGEAAPFIAAAPLTGTVGTGVQLTRGGATLVPQVTSTAGRTGISGALGATEAATIAAGEGAAPDQIATSALLGGALGAGAERLAALKFGSPDQLPQRLIDEGEELIRRAPTGKEIARALDDAAPTQEQLFRASNELFEAANDSGVIVKDKFFSGFVRNLRKKLEDKGLDIPKQGGVSNTPEATRALQRLEELVGGAPTFRQIDQARETAQAAANSTNKKVSALGVEIIDQIDSLFNSLDARMLEGGNNLAVNQVKTARKLWGQGRRSQMINEAIEKARGQASGFENGIRVQFRQILNSDKKKKFFSKEELKAMNSVVQGTKGANIAKLFGRFALSEGQATNIVGGAIGGSGGAALGALAGSGGAAVGALVVPAIGQVSRGLAQKLTLKNARLADRVIRAGNNAEQIARAYMANVPKSQQSAQELSELLMRPDVNLDKAGSELAVQAAEIAKKQRQQRALITGAGLTSAAAVAAEEE
jgi:hypothetical protein